MVETLILLVSSLLLGIGSLVLAGWLVISHQIMDEKQAPEGKMVALVGAPRTGLKDS